MPKQFGNAETDILGDIRLTIRREDVASYIDLLESQPCDKGFLEDAQSLREAYNLFADLTREKKL